MTPSSSSNSSWKDIYLSCASDPHYSGCSLSFIKATSCPSSPFIEPAETPNEFYESLLAEKSALKQLIDHELSNTKVKRFNDSPALAASIWIGDLITDVLNLSNLRILFCPKNSHTNAKESELESGLWIMDGKNVRLDIQLVS
jgi:hypothetical protein